MRHGYSQRASEVYGMSDRITAANIDYSLKTNNAHHCQIVQKTYHVQDNTLHIEINLKLQE